jgi:transcriptional regulator with XRE-family HTH domain
MLSKRIKNLRERHGYTQQEFADAIGATQSLVGRWEAGKVIPSAEYIGKIASAFNVTSDYLLGLVDVPTAQIQFDDLSDEEQALIQFLRSGMLSDALEAFASLSKGK